MRTLAQRIAAAPPPDSPAGTIFYDDFSAPVAAWAKAMDVAIRDLATYESPPVSLAPGDPRPSAAIVNGLNQQVTVRWQLSGDGSTWINGDAGTVVAAGANALMAPNSIQAPYSRLTAVAAVAPTSGTLTVNWYVPSPRWQLAGVGEASMLLEAASIQAGIGPLEGSRALSLRTRKRSAAVNDSASASRWIPIPASSRVLELGALVGFSGPGGVVVDLEWNDFGVGPFFAGGGVSFDHSTGGVSIKGSSGAYQSLATGPIDVSYDWLDLRVALNPVDGRYAYVALGGIPFGGGVKAPATSNDRIIPPVAKILINERTLAAASQLILVDRVWIREIG